MIVTIISIHHTQPPSRGYIYIGRNGRNHLAPFHFGNPFTHIQHANHLATIQVPSRLLAVLSYDSWLQGAGFTDLQQDRRAWILAQIDEIAAAGDDVTLGCFCKPRDGFHDEHTCHGQVLATLIAEARQRITPPYWHSHVPTNS